MLALINTQKGPGMNIRHTINLVEASQKLEKIHLNPLAYKMSALEPCMSENCVRVHYDILTQRYFDKYAETGDLFQKAGAVLHNDYYWPCMQPYSKKNSPTILLQEMIDNSHGSFAKMQDKVLETALAIQGNGWVLIMQDLQIVSVQNHVIKPGIILAIDIWEHATVDYDYNREKFLKNYWNIVNWKKVESLLE